MPFFFYQFVLQFVPENISNDSSLVCSRLESLNVFRGAVQNEVALTNRKSLSVIQFSEVQPSWGWGGGWQEMRHEPMAGEPLRRSWLHVASSRATCGHCKVV